ncbi:hypothetical protein [Vibrio owensii]|uniref:hypothetical protein n=1 Tax=Vibrio owensii TaxID=696485 RepID=UPI003CC512DF
MEHQTLEIVRLSNFETVQDIEKHKLPGGSSANGLAILFGRASEHPFEMQRELALLGLMQLSSSVRGLDCHHPHREDGEIDPDLKDFLYQFSQLGTWLLNSSSVRDAKLDELASFDRIDLKEKLLNLANKL